MADTGAILFEYLKDILYYPAKANLDVDQLPPEFQNLGQGLQFLDECLREEREFGKALARGELDAVTPGAENVLTAPLKELQGALRHLAWQTQQVAKGDYGQKVEFMGEFSEAFNSMTRQLKERQDALMRMIYVDSLTGLYNRRYAWEQMDILMEKGGGFVFAFADVDHLKYCNDVFGHKVGDEYLVDVANILKAMGGEAARLGGDEFAVIWKDSTDADALTQKLESARLELSEGEDQREYPRSFSYAVCTVPTGTTEPISTYIRATDAEMYEYKHKHKKHCPVNYVDDRD